MFGRSIINRAVSAIVITVACAMIIVGSFMYGRIIGTHYRSTIEVTVSSFADDIGGWINEAKEYLYGALNLAENPT